MVEQLSLLNVLLVEDTPSDQQWIRELTETIGVQRIEIAETGADAESRLRTGRYNTAIIDLDLPDGRERGLQILEADAFENIFKIMLTRWEDYFLTALLHGARRFITKRELNEDADRLRLAFYDAALFVRHRLAIHYQSEVMSLFFRKVAAVARRNEPVLIRGESGSGKELVARAIHEISGRSSGPFVAVNCACLDPTSAEADLFGVALGGFTDVAARPGAFERAHSGTLFLDEIAALALHEQSRLLRVLEHPEELERSGGHTPVRGPHGEALQFRVVFATDRDLAEEVERQRFHGPLYQRVCGQILEVPPLNERREDIPLLARAFLRRGNESTSRLSKQALDVLRQEDWTGRNVRGLWNTLARALVLAETREDNPCATVTGRDVEDALRAGRPASHGEKRSDLEGLMRLDATLNDVEAAYIQKVLEAHEGRIAEVARVLGIGRNTLYDKI
jgi:two-component system response regulator HydG